jgi:hypothetical protein
MNSVQIASLISALLGAAGTLVLFRGSYALEPFSGGIFGGPEINADNARIRRENKQREKMQKVGLVLLCASFVVQAAMAFL